MNCREARRSIGAARDQRLSQQGVEALRVHLASCAACRDEERIQEKVGQVLRRDFGAEVPAGLANRAYRSAMESRPRPRPPFLASLFPLVWPSAAAASALSVALLTWALMAGSQSLGVSVDASGDLLGRALGTSVSWQVSQTLEAAVGLDMASSALGGER